MIDFDNLPPLREVIKKYELSPKKSLGQNFLLDLNLTRKIARLGNVQEGTTIIEVGCGPAGLTRSILQEYPNNNLIVIEKDERCVNALKEVLKDEIDIVDMSNPALVENLDLKSDSSSNSPLGGESKLGKSFGGGYKDNQLTNTPHSIITDSTNPNSWTLPQVESESVNKSTSPQGEREKNSSNNQILTIIQDDAMEIDYQQIAPGKKAIIANLPYNIATPLLIGWLKQIDDFESLTLMFQKEVANRIIAKVGDKPYGRLAVMSNWLCETKIVLNLPPQAFTPPPKVSSSVVHFRPKPDREKVEFQKVEQVVKLAFGQRRKMLRQSCKTILPILNDCHIDVTKRAENLTIEEYVKIANKV